MKELIIAMTTLFLVGSVLAAGPSLDAFEFARPEPGTKVQWKNITTGFSYTYTVRKADEGENYGYTFFTETGEKRTAYLFCGYCGHPSNAIKIKKYSDLYPLKVGSNANVRRWRVGNSVRNWTHKIKVTGTEAVRVAFRDRPIDTYVIEEEVWNNQTRQKWTTTYWFAPSLMNNVKIVGNLNENSELQTFELLNYIQP